MEAWECGSEILFTLCIATISTQRTFLLTPKLSYSHTPILSSAPNAHVVGKDGFEPPNSGENRFTVCCRWPLDYLPDGCCFRVPKMNGFISENCLFYQLSLRGESNPRPADYKSAALPTELLRHDIFPDTIIPLYKELKLMELSARFFGKAKVSEFVKWKNFEVFFILNVS